MILISSEPGYFVLDGEIIGLRGRPLTQFLRRKYLRVQINGRQRLVNRLLCEAYHGPPPTPRHHAAHLDGNSLNNSPKNLAWKTHIENQLDVRKHGTFKGVKHPSARFTEAEILEIIRRRKSGEFCTTIHRDYPHVSYSTITAITSGRNWSHVSFHPRDQASVRVG